MHSYLFSFILLLTQLRINDGCGTGIGGTNDYEIIEDPVFNADISPAVGWTYFPTPPPNPPAPTFFVGQSNDSMTAKSRADTEITAAVLAAMTEAELPTYGVVVTNTYQPEAFTNPPATPVDAVTRYGKLEGGAITQSSMTMTMFTWIPYMRTIDITIRKARTTRYTWNIVRNNLLQKLSLNYNVKFYGDVTVNKF